MAVERDHGRQRTECFGTLADVVDDGLMAEVHPVVRTDRDHGTAARPGRRVEIGDGLHPQRLLRRIIGAAI